ncbi:MAG: AAA family ATPase [Chloroflexi bacterium]|nr:AAA family ATPase [Chloroflexota bacterium]
MLYISRVSIKNYRRLRNIEVPLKPHSVVIGESNAGKTSLLDLLETALSPTRRFPFLEESDVAHGLKPEDTAIEALIEICPLNSKVFATEERVKLDPRIDVAADGHERLLLKLDYSFDATEGAFRTRVRFVKSDGKDAGALNSQIRRMLSFFVVQALRNAARDIVGRGGTWGRMVGGLQLQPASKDKIKEVAEKAASEILGLVLGEAAFTQTQARFTEFLAAVLWSEVQPGQLTFSAFPAEQRDLLQAMQILVKNPGDLEGVGILDHGDGTQSVAVVALMLAYIEALGYLNARIAVEEPEGHLHPHATRALVRHLWSKPQQVILTTHSTHVTDVVSLGDVVLLKRRGSQTVARSIPDRYFSPQELRELHRHVHTAGSEFLFAKCVLLVEGVTELAALPIFARALQINFDRSGISIVQVAGQNFRPFVRLFQPSALDIPYLILCDNDQATVDTASMLRDIGLLHVDVQAASTHTHRKNLHSAGLYFLPKGTFETYVMSEGHVAPYEEAIARVFGKGRLESYIKKRIASDKSYALVPKEQQIMDLIKNDGNKPELAYEVASIVTNDGKDPSKIPTYFGEVLKAITDIARKELAVEDGDSAQPAK